MSKRRIFALPAGWSGCAYWRFRTPLNKLKTISSKLDITIADNPNKQVRLQDIQDHIESSDLVVLQAPGYKDALTLMKLYKSEGKKVVVDYDDFSFDLSPGNPRYNELGTKEATEVGLDGQAAFRWRDQENGFDLKHNNEKYEAFKQAVSLADMVTTTTNYLASKFTPYNKNVSVCPNSIDVDLFRPIPRPIGMEEVRIGWFGGDSHFADLKLLKTLLPRITKRYHNVKIVIQAPPVPQWHDFFKDVPGDQIEWNFWADLRYYPLFLASRHFDIGLCPLANNEFNKCKSSLKFLEFASLKAAVVAQNMLPYAADIDGMNGFLADSEDQWFDAICRLVEDQALRQQTAMAGYDYVYEKFNMRKNCLMWEDAYLKCLGA